METYGNAQFNPEAFLQIGDYVAATFFFSSLALLITCIFIFIRFKRIPPKWKTVYLIAGFVPLVAALNTFYRRSYWISTQTNPVEFKFFDWFLTVPLMSIVFYYLLRPYCKSMWMLARLFFASLWMLIFGYLGEALLPEDSVKWGILGSIGFAALIGIIMGEGYPIIFGKKPIDPAIKKGYLYLSLLLPIAWSIYPIGYMTGPGNLLEGSIPLNFVHAMYNIADVFAKCGLAIGVYFTVTRSAEVKSSIMREFRAITPSRVQDTDKEDLNGVFKKEVPSEYYRKDN